jgi:uncharacterized membrane protein YhhN
VVAGVTSSSVHDIYPVLACVAAVIGLLVAEQRNSRLGIWIAKPLAASAYVWSALAWGALQSSYGRWLLVGLICCWWGDLLLVPRHHRRAFRAGILAFLLGHVAYVIAFSQHRIDHWGLALGVGLALVLAGFVARWLGPKLPTAFRKLVWAYVAVISGMLIAAFGAAMGSGPAGIAIGAVLFAVSDLTVARDRFVSHAFVNRLLGLPLYFAAQLVLARTVTAIPA